MAGGHGFRLWELDVLDRDCPACGRMMHICDHRSRRFHTLDGPVELICKLNHCPDPPCPGHAKTKSPEHEITIALPHWAIGWDVFCWIGHRRFSRHMAIPRSRAELLRRLRASSSPTTAIARVPPALPGHARGAAARPRVAPPRIRIGDGDHPVDRRPPAREGTRDALRRARVDPEAGLVRRAVALGHRGRGPASDREGQGVGRILGQAGGALDVGQAGRVRHGDRGGIPRRAAPLLRQPFPPRSGQARPGGRQPGQGPDAEEGAAACGRSSKPCSSGKPRPAEEPHAPRPRRPSRRRPRRRTWLLPRSIRPAPWCWTIARRCAGSSTTIKGGRCIHPGCGWPRRWTRSGSRSSGTWTQKKGVRGGATRAAGRMHRERPGRSQESNKRSSESTSR